MIVFMKPQFFDLLSAPPPLSRPIRQLNPFDPAVRDRARLERLFAFAYRNEMFVPRNQRRWGYYVNPMLEGLRFAGRIELKPDRGEGELLVSGFWREAWVKCSESRQAGPEGELIRFARFAGLEHVRWVLEPGRN